MARTVEVGQLGEISWRGPFLGVSALMVVAVVVAAVLLPATPRAERATTLSAQVTTVPTSVPTR